MIKYHIDITYQYRCHNLLPRAFELVLLYRTSLHQHLIPHPYIPLTQVIAIMRTHVPGGHSITKHMGGWLEGLSQKRQNIYPKIAILKQSEIIPPKVQSENSKISNLGQIIIFTENCTPNYPYESF